MGQQFLLQARSGALYSRHVGTVGYLLYMLDDGQFRAATQIRMHYGAEQPGLATAIHIER